MVNPDIRSSVVSISSIPVDVRMAQIKMVGTANPYDGMHNNFEPTACAISEKTYHVLFEASRTRTNIGRGETIDWF
jgi:hypothetical protein